MRGNLPSRKNRNRRTRTVPRPQSAKKHIRQYRGSNGHKKSDGSNQRRQDSGPMMQGALRMSSKSRNAIKADIPDRKSTRLNSSHQIISYAVFCLKKKKTNNAS